MRRSGPATWLAAVLAAAVPGLAGPVARAASSGALGTWSETPSMHTPRSFHTATLLPNGRVLVVGGCRDARPVSSIQVCRQPLASAELYDPLSRTWRDAAPLHTGRFRHTATLLEIPACRRPKPPPRCGQVLVAGGSEAADVASISAELYDPATDRWQVTGSLGVSRNDHTATLLDGPACASAAPAEPCGRVLVAGGYGSRQGPGATQRRGCGLPCPIETAEVYDPLSGGWHPVASLARAHWQASATLLPDGRVLVDGGITTGCDGCLADPEIFDPQTGGWSPAAGNHIPRFQHTATLLSGSPATCGASCGRVLVVGGRIQGNAEVLTETAEIYDPTGSDPTVNWRPIRVLPSTRATHTATQLPGGRVLVAGGFLEAEGAQGLVPQAASGKEPTPTAELYDPLSRQWSAAAPMRVARSGSSKLSGGHTATLLSADPAAYRSNPAVCGVVCGMVLVVGGFGSRGVLASAELYTPPGVALPAAQIATVAEPERDLPRWFLAAAAAVTLLLLLGFGLRWRRRAHPPGRPAAR